MRENIYKETFKSPFKKETYDEAMAVLNEIRKVHSIQNGWIEIDAYIETLPDGKFRAVRIHQKFL